MWATKNLYSPGEIGIMVSPVKLTCILLPGRPPRCIILESGEITPVKVKYNAGRVQEILDATETPRTLVFYSELERKYVEKPPIWINRVTANVVFNYTYRWVTLTRDTYTELKSSRTVRSMILESCKPYIVEFDREYTVGTVVWEAPYIKEFYYVSTNKISRIDVKHERRYRRLYGKRYYTDKCRRVIWNRFRALLIS